MTLLRYFALYFRFEAEIAELGTQVIVRANVTKR